ncbi:hypothetical protein VW29_18380 [Devosia limi DSM 17137]|uniref:Uncharacterized protein n=1 Tax=Devosia limi DSM 17137 TaxID=1121477 RepID=A0A0F5L530_9HYPH|nr:hypothetical protein [Devosia limi]KKB77330.1 hypothetical protein VW29_18380 [Devosia limi DSM 17137]SHE66452.1 hypothetical protein SAMN02745223_00834 [Devosia limi DSM 17137]
MAIPIPHFLHDVFGTSQTPFQLAAIIAFGLAVPVALALQAPDLLASLPPWRLVLAGLIIADIAAGCVANLTRSTNDFYAVRPRNRWVFIAIHGHIVATALLLGADLMASIAIWAFTIAGAVIVNLLKRQQDQVFVAGLLLAIGLTGIALWPGMTQPMICIGALFMLKVLVHFAVDHSRDSRNVA